ncbi:MAG: hypothetical protein JRJ26_16790 [Deltaproteobacteria bacterium]|nr:hypothetical protein [Deltaproteobacteria bacterium]
MKGIAVGNHTHEELDCEHRKSFERIGTMKRLVGLFVSVVFGLFFIFLACPHAARGAIAVDNVSTGTTDGGSTITISHQASGSDRLMLVGVSFNNDSYETVAGITYNGVPLSFVGEDQRDDDARVEIWMLVGPDLGTHDVEVTFNTALYRQAIAGVVTFTGVDQTSPLGTFASEHGDGSTASVDVPSATGELVFGIVAAETPSGLTAGSGQTEHWNLSMGGGRDFREAVGRDGLPFGGNHLANERPHLFNRHRLGYPQRRCQRTGDDQSGHLEQRSWRFGYVFRHRHLEHRQYFPGSGDERDYRDRPGRRRKYSHGCHYC